MGRKVVILTAMAIEMRPIASALNLRRVGRLWSGLAGDINVVGAQLGVGRRATAATEELLAFHQPQLVILAGFSGGLDSFLRTGYLVAPRRIIGEHGEGYDLDGGVPRLAAGPAQGPVLLSVRQAALTPEDKQSLRSRYGAAAVDMESLAVATVTAQLHLPLLVMRTISDAADDAVPSWASQLLREDGAADAAAAMLMLLRYPGRLAMMLRLRRGAKLAAESLGAAVPPRLAAWSASGGAE